MPTLAQPTSSGVRSHPPVWLFSFLPIAGASVPFAFIAMPFLLRREGVSVATIGGISGLAMLPLALAFLYAPLADVLLSRRNWVLAGSFVASVLLFFAILLPRPRYLTLFVVCLLLANVASSLFFTAAQGLMAVLLPDGVRGKAAGWFQAGNLGSIPLIGGATLWLIQRYSLFHAAIGIALIGFLPALTVLLIKEPSRALAPDRAVLKAMFGEMAALLKKRPTWLGLCFFLSPLAAGAAYNLFTAIGGDYHASPGTVLCMTAMPGGLLAMTGGALLAGVISDYFPRRTTFILFGTLIALVAVVMAVAPLRPTTFAVGVLAYQVALSMTLAAGTALSLELSGGEPATAGTRMMIFTSALLAPNSYMAWVDGRGFGAWGVRGLFWTDAGCGLAGAVVLVILARKFWRSETKTQRAAALERDGLVSDLG